MHYEFIGLTISALALSSAWMAAVSWYVGLVHYPTFRLIPDERWNEFHSHHTLWTGVLVGVPMLIQIGATIALFSIPIDPALRLVSAVLLILSVGWTGVISGPKHKQLETKDDKVIASLIGTNHVRSIAWTIQALLAIAMLLSRQ
jgi:hypothetical protein